MFFAGVARAIRRSNNTGIVVTKHLNWNGNFVQHFFVSHHPRWPRQLEHCGTLRHCLYSLLVVEVYHRVLIALAPLDDATQNRNDSICAMSPREAKVSRSSKIGLQYLFANEEKSAASFCNQVAALVPDMF